MSMHKHGIIKLLFPNKKTMSLHLSKISHSRLTSSRYVFAVLLVLVAIGATAWHQKVAADTFTDQLNALSQKNAEAKQVLNSLQTQAASYQQVIDGLTTQISSLQTSIEASQQQQAKLEADIKTNQDELDKQRAVLSNDIKTMYVDGTPDTMEMLASSKNLSDYVDKQEYRTRVQNKIQDTMVKINELQKQLQDQKAQVEQLIKEQQTQQAQLDASRTQQQQLLGYNQDQQATYTAQIQANKAEMAKVQAAQRAALASINSGGGSGYIASSTGGSIHYLNNTAGQYCGGGYSYCWAGFDQVVSDPWGLNWARECVHYVADYLDREGKQVPNFGGGNGYAYMWVGYTTALGVASVTTSPEHGDVAYMPIGGYGHVGIVEYANGDGTYHISQMNWPYGGYYSEMDVYPQNITFLHFNNR